MLELSYPLWHRLLQADVGQVLAVVIDPGTCPVESCEQSLFFRIKSADYPGGLNHLCVAGDGSAACISLRRNDVLLLKYGVTEDAVSLVACRFHQRTTSTCESRASTRSTFPSGVIRRGIP